MKNHRELSIDELGTVSGGDFSLGCLLDAYNKSLEGRGNATGSSTPTGGGRGPGGDTVRVKIEAAYAALK
jgi:hypothetical protein